MPDARDRDNHDRIADFSRPAAHQCAIACDIMERFLFGPIFNALAIRSAKVPVLCACPTALQHISRFVPS
jgi:hypothetical protein